MRLLRRRKPEPAPSALPTTLGELTREHLGVWVVIHATERLMLGELGEIQRDYDGHLLEVAHRPHTRPEHARTRVQLLRFRGEANEERITRGFRSDTPIEVRR